MKLDGLTGNVGNLLPKLTGSGSSGTGGAGAALGATLGSVIPGVGTALGGILGGVVDFFTGLAKGPSVDLSELKERWQKDFDAAVAPHIAAVDASTNWDDFLSNLDKARHAAWSRADFSLKERNKVLHDDSKQYHDAHYKAHDAVFKALVAFDEDAELQFSKGVPFQEYRNSFATAGAPVPNSSTPSGAPRITGQQVQEITLPGGRVGRIDRPGPAGNDEESGGGLIIMAIAAKFLFGL